MPVLGRALKNLRLRDKWWGNHHWTHTVEPKSVDPQVRELLRFMDNRAFIAGGWIRRRIPTSVYNRIDQPMVDEGEGDIDVYLRTPNRRGHWPNKILENMLDLGYILNRRSEFAREYWHPNKPYLKVQLINPLKDPLTVGHPMKVLSYFDFTINQVALVPWRRGYRLLSTDSALSDINNRTLRLNHIPNPVGIILRYLKFQRMGYLPVDNILYRCLSAWDSYPKEVRDKWLFKLASGPFNTYEFIHSGVEESLSRP